MDFIGAARSALLIAPNPEDSDQKIMLHIKHNVGPKGQSWAYRLATKPGEKLPHVKWEGLSPITVEALAKAASSQKPRDEASDFLRRALNDGPRKAAEIERLAEFAGLPKRTLARAKQMLNITSFQKSREWWWKLPG